MCLLATGAAFCEALHVRAVCSFCFLGCLPHFCMDKFEQSIVINPKRWKATTQGQRWEKSLVCLHGDDRPAFFFFPQRF